MGASDDDGQAWERVVGAASVPLSPGYAPRSPERTPLHRAPVRVLRLLKGVLGDEEPDVDALAELCAASMTARSSGSRDATPERLTAFLEGFSLHAGVHLHANDRRGLEQLCRYGARALRGRPWRASEARGLGGRGAIALSRLSELEDGRYAYRMKRPLLRCTAALASERSSRPSAAADGRTQLVLDGVGLLKKLAPLIPPPRFHLLRFHGVFAPNANLRSRVVPKPQPTDEAAATTAAKADRPKERPTASPYRLDWAAALKRVFAAARPVASRPRRARRAGAASTCSSARAAAGSW